MIVVVPVTVMDRSTDEKQDGIIAVKTIAKDESKTTNVKPMKKPRPKKTEPGFHKIMFEETSYYFKNGLRYVYPYSFTFTTHVKGRWLSLTVLELFSKEFHMETMEYYKKAIKIGKIKVNNEVVSADRILTHNEVLTTQVHRHEPPVIHEEIEFLENDDEMVVINKPSSIPVHPCGRYRHNTIVFILGKEYGLEKLHTIHRIDRLTSGILMFSKVPAKAREMEQAVHGRQVEKEYLARVVGELPLGEICVDEPILTTSHKIGVCQVHPDGKPCSTVFQRLSYNGNSSVVCCKPHTGRMHQIRIHLQWLGFPIINDPIYNHATAWGVGKGRKGTEINVKEVIAELIRTRKDNSYEDELNTDKPVVGDATNNKVKNEKKFELGADDNDRHSSVNKTISESHKEVNMTKGGSSSNLLKTFISQDSPDSKRRKIEKDYKSYTECNNLTTNSNILEQSDNKTCIEPQRVCYMSRDLGEGYYDDDCTECKKTWKEPLQSELVMYLHAYQYKGPGWKYKTSKPKWAEDEWKDH